MMALRRHGLFAPNEARYPAMAGRYIPKTKQKYYSASILTNFSINSK